ncbi:hypothetical protein B0H13DRAFT_2304004 [Mycena leptocephala]|nr:hypothetical protein B0H13DRAFT_2304004 [Mycena leptocephala]
MVIDTTETGHFDGYSRAVKHGAARKAASDDRVANSKAVEVVFAAGDLVQVLDPKPQKTFLTTKKILPEWSDTFRVKERILNSYIIETIYGQSDRENPDPPQDHSSDVYVPGGQDSDSDLTQSLEHAISSKEKKLAKKKQKKAEDDEPDPNRSNQCGTQREILKHSTLFDEALAVIYGTIGCADIPKKPLLSCKLSNAAVKAPAINLGSAKDWEGCLEDMTGVQKKKKIQVSVSIIVTDQYMVSLRAKIGLNNLGAVHKGKSKKLLILDLEHASSGDDDFDDGLGIMEKETNYNSRLDDMLRPLIRPTIPTPGLRDATSMHRPHPLRDTTSTRRPHPPREPRALHHLQEQKSLSPQLRAHLAVAGSLTERVYSRMRPPMPLLPHFLLL